MDNFLDNNIELITEFAHFPILIKSFDLEGNDIFFTHYRSGYIFVSKSLQESDLVLMKKVFSEFQEITFYEEIGNYNVIGFDIGYVGLPDSKRKMLEKLQDIIVEYYKKLGKEYI